MMLASTSSRALGLCLSRLSSTGHRIQKASQCPSRPSPASQIACQNMSTRQGHEPNWDHIFRDLEETPPPIPQTNVGPRRPRRQTMTAQEIKAFNEVFNLIFDSMSEKAGDAGQSSSINTANSGMADLFSTLRRHSKRTKWTTEATEELDRKKDGMDRCTTDRQLLEWAMREVFGESQTYEQDFNKARAEAEDGAELPALQPATYPHTIALLMKTFRDRYRDPHLALSMFDYARHLSIASYVFGCSTSAYNELIDTRWTCFKDLKGVHDAIEEMYINGVDMDNRTKELAETVRHEVGSRNIWMEEGEIGANGAWTMLQNIERLVNSNVATSGNKPTDKRKGPWNDWRALEQSEKVAPEWEFDKW